jgi:hypothetical protein
LIFEAGRRSSLPPFGNNNPILPRRLTRIYRTSTLNTDALGQVNSPDIACGRSRSLRIRLQCYDDAGAGDAMLQVHALLVAWPSGSGLLQDHADHPRPFCGGLRRAWRLGRTRRARSCASVGRMPWLRFLRSNPCSAVSRSANLLPSSFAASSNLARPPVVSRLHANVCLESLSLFCWRKNS